jgi:quinol monooxygenase YgiN
MWRNPFIYALMLLRYRTDGVERLVLGPVVMVRLTVALRAPSARFAQDLLEAFRYLVVGTRLEPGCLGCSAWIDPDSTVRYVEEWHTETDMRRRVRSDRFTSVLSIVEAAQEPQVQFDFVTSTRGLDYVEQVRSDVVT